MIEENKQKKNKVIKGIALLGLFLMVFGISYALFRVTLNGNKTNKIKTGKMQLELLNENGETINGDTIGLENALPITDEEGKELVPYSFTLKNSGTIDTEYSLTLKDMGLDTGEERLDDKYVTVYLEIEEPDIGYVRKEGPMTLAAIENRIIDAGVIESQKDINYKLYTWLDITADENAMGKVFSTNLEVNGTQINNTTPSRSIVYMENAIMGSRKRKAGKDSKEYTYEPLTSIYTIYEDGTVVISGTGTAQFGGGNQLNTLVNEKLWYQGELNLLKSAGYDIDDLTTIELLKEYEKNNNINMDDDDDYYDALEAMQSELFNKYSVDDYSGNEYYLYNEAFHLYNYDSEILKKLYQESYLNTGLLAELINKVIVREGIVNVSVVNTLASEIVLPNGLESVSLTKNVFLTDVTLPNTLKTISMIGFVSLNKLDTLVIPASVINVPSNAFSGWSNTQTIIIKGSTDSWTAGWNSTDANIVYDN